MYRCNRGFTLVEVLVSLVILSLGLMGIAKLMLYSSHSNDSAYLRSQATNLAYQMLDDMRANNAAIASYATASTLPVADPGLNCVGAASTCSNSDIALYDIYQWKLRLNATASPAPPPGTPPGALPEGEGKIVTTATPLGTQTQVTIWVFWNDSVAQNSLNSGGVAKQSIVLESVL